MTRAGHRLVVSDGDWYDDDDPVENRRWRQWRGQTTINKEQQIQLRWR
jgi:hypothetical protein